MKEVVLWGVNFSTDALIQTFGGLVGSFFGALIAGLYAVRVMKTQILFSTRQEEKKEITSFITFYNNFSPLMTSAMITCKSIKDLATKNNPTYGDLQVLDGFNRFLENDINELDSLLTRSILPHDIHFQFIGCRESLKLLLSISSDFFKSNSNEKDLEDFNYAFTKLESVLTYLYEYKTKKEIDIKI